MQICYKYTRSIYILYYILTIKRNKGPWVIVPLKFLLAQPFLIKRFKLSAGSTALHVERAACKA